MYIFLFILGVYTSEKCRLPIMVTEKMQLDLNNLVGNYEKIPLNVKLSILDDVCLGLRYLHSRNPPIVHGNLTPNNVLLGGHLEAKITDLGIRMVTTNLDNHYRCYMPSESEALSEAPVYDPPFDIFFYGGMIIKTINQEDPDPTNVGSEAIRRQGCLERVKEIGRDFLRSLAMSCLNDRPGDRPSAKQMSEEIRRAGNESGHGGMTPAAWWVEASNSLVSCSIMHGLILILDIFCCSVTRCCMANMNVTSNSCLSHQCKSYLITTDTNRYSYNLLIHLCVKFSSIASYI